MSMLGYEIKKSCGMIMLGYEAKNPCDNHICHTA